MQPFWVLVCLFSVLITDAAAQSCPANLNSEAQIVLVFDRTVPLDDLPAAGVDTNFTFFREVLGYDDTQIQQETQNAFQFLNETFGLDFSQSEPNERGIRFFQNATFQPIRRPSPNATFNRWSISGRTESRCFMAAIGGFFVSFTGKQTLRETYGGEEGIQVTSSRALGYEYISISIPGRESVVILRRTPVPNESARIGLFVLFYELFHPTLGQGAQQGFFQTERATGNGTEPDILRQSGSAVFTFPPNVLSFN